MYVKGYIYQLSRAITRVLLSLGLDGSSSSLLNAVDDDDELVM